MVKGGEINRKEINTRKGEVNNKTWKVLQQEDDENQTHVRRLEIKKSEEGKAQQRKRKTKL